MVFQDKEMSEEELFKSFSQQQPVEEELDNPGQFGDEAVSEEELFGLNTGQDPQAPPQPQGVFGNPNPISLGMEAIGGFNRAIPGFIDALGVDTVNAILSRSGVDYQLPKVVDTLGLGKTGDFAGKGLAADTASRMGEGASMALGMVGAGQKLIKEGAGTAKDQLGRILAGEGAQKEAALGALSGVGSAIGEEVGGTPGSIVGGILAPGIAPGRAAPQLGDLEAQRTLPPPKFEGGDINTTNPTTLKEEISMATPQRAAQLADPDTDTLKMLSDFGVTAVPPAGVVSNNPAFVSMEGPLSASSRSPIRSQNDRFLKDLSDQVGTFFKTHGASVNEDGLVDFSKINDKFRTDSSNLVDDIYEGESIFYNAIRKVAPKTDRMLTKNTFELMDEIGGEQGAFENLPGPLREIFNKLKSGEAPTYGFMDTTRQEIGRAISKKQGVFKDANVGMLKRIYGSLADDINNYLGTVELPNEIPGIGFNADKNLTAKDLVEQANKMTVKRKTIESSLVDVLGKDLSKELSSTLSKDIKNLRKGEMQGFGKTMAALRKITGGNYESSFRQEAVMTAIRDQFKGPNGDLLLDPTKYRQFMDNLNSNKNAKKLLYRELPKNTKLTMEGLGKLSKRVYQYNKGREKTGLNWSAYDDPNKGLIARLYDAKGMDALAQVSDMVTMKLFNVRSGTPIKNMYTSVKKQNLSMDTKVTNLLTSDSFQKALVNKDGLAIQEIPAYKKWLNSISPASQDSIARRGPIAYFLAQDEDEE